MIEFYSDLGQIDPEHICQGELKSEVMFKEDKKYHIDLKVSDFALFVCGRRPKTEDLLELFLLLFTFLVHFLI